MTEQKKEVIDVEFKVTGPPDDPNLRTIVHETKMEVIDLGDPNQASKRVNSLRLAYRLRLAAFCVGGFSLETLSIAISHAGVTSSNFSEVGLGLLLSFLTGTTAGLYADYFDHKRNQLNEIERALIKRTTINI